MVSNSLKLVSLSSARFNFWSRRALRKCPEKMPLVVSQICKCNILQNSRRLIYGFLPSPCLKSQNHQFWESETWSFISSMIFSQESHEKYSRKSQDLETLALHSTVWEGVCFKKMLYNQMSRSILQLLFLCYKRLYLVTNLGLIFDDTALIDRDYIRLH